MFAICSDVILGDAWSPSKSGGYTTSGSRIVGAGTPSTSAHARADCSTLRTTTLNVVGEKSWNLTPGWGACARLCTPATVRSTARRPTSLTTCFMFASGSGIAPEVREKDRATKSEYTSMGAFTGVYPLNY